MMNKAICPDCGGRGMLMINSKPPVFCDTCNGMGEVEAECGRCKQLEAEAAVMQDWLNTFKEDLVAWNQGRVDPNELCSDMFSVIDVVISLDAGKALLERVQKMEAIIDLLKQKKQICAEWQGQESNPSNKEFIEAMYTIKELDRRIDFAIDALEGEK